METVFGIVMVIFGFALICLVVYVLFFQKDKNPYELTNLEKRYVDPVLAEKQKAELNAANALAEAKAKAEGIVVKIDGKVKV